MYFARPDSIIDNISVYKARMRMGELLAEKIRRVRPHHDIDVVIPIPDTSRTSAMQVAQILGVKYREGFIKNRYIGRTFIMPGQEQRQKSVRSKLNAIDLEFRGKNVLLVDDSIVRGTTSAQIIEIAREAGANKVYFASAAPPVRYPNVYGIDMPAASELVAAGRTEEEIAEIIGADWLIYQDIEDLVRAVRHHDADVTNFDASCFSGEYVTGDITPEYLAKLQIRTIGPGEVAAARYRPRHPQGCRLKAGRSAPRRPRVATTAAARLLPGRARRGRRRRCVREHLQIECAKDARQGDWHVIGVGKAAGAMALGALDVLGTRDRRGSRDHAARHVPADFPSSDARASASSSGHTRFPTAIEPHGRRAARAVHGRPAAQMPRCLCLVSGGASSLVEWPVPGIDLADLQRVGMWAMTGGQPIDVVNAVRRPAFAAERRRPRELLGQRRTLALMISDVPGDDPRVIGSGLLHASSDS